MKLFYLLIISFLSLCSSGLYADDNPYLHQLPGDIILGDSSAPVTLIEYSSLSCPACGFFHEDVMPEIEANYITTGKVKFVFRNYPMHQIDIKAAATTLCGGPERYYTFIKALFRTQKNWARETKHGVEVLENIAKMGGVSGDAIKQCLEDKILENKIIETRQLAQNELKINSTPTLIINGKIYADSISKKALINAIELALNANK